ncbi:hypothetical protein MUK42_03731 [Musa troglodytarum]|uniref:Uncharacterized protein n=1 Tax=Musa troglodytarum TaxID=320322 RepID=A0A9E7GH71_9LILI|nr:hypothetical protein MUK42_03731 [Musa troglodytarum]
MAGRGREAVEANPLVLRGKQTNCRRHHKTNDEVAQQMSNHLILGLLKGYNIITACRLRMPAKAVLSVKRGSGRRGCITYYSWR